MEAVTVVVAAVAAGAGVGAGNVASTAVMDAYQGLKGLVLGRLHGGGLMDGEALLVAADSPDDRAVLIEALTEVGVDAPTEEAARRLLELIDAAGQGKFVVDASQAKGLIVGDGATQHNTFN